MQNKKRYSAEEKQAFYIGYGVGAAPDFSKLLDNKSNAFVDSFTNGFIKGADSIATNKRKKTVRKTVKNKKGR